MRMQTDTECIRKWSMLPFVVVLYRRRGHTKCRRSTKSVYSKYLVLTPLGHIDYSAVRLGVCTPLLLLTEETQHRVNGKGLQSNNTCYQTLCVTEFVFVRFCSTTTHPEAAACPFAALRGGWAISSNSVNNVDTAHRASGVKLKGSATRRAGPPHTVPLGMKLPRRPLREGWLCSIMAAEVHVHSPNGDQKKERYWVKGLLVQLSL